MGATGGAIPRNHGQNAGKRRFRHQNRRTARRRRCRRTAAFKLPGIERSLKAGHQSRSQPPAPPLRRAPFRCRQNLLLDTPLGQTDNKQSEESADNTVLLGKQQHWGLHPKTPDEAEVQTTLLNEAVLCRQPEKITDFIRQKYGKTNLIFHSLFAGTQEGNVPFRASPIYIKLNTDNMYENSPICLLFEELCQTESMINIIGSTQNEAIFVKHLKNYLSICDENGTPYLFRWYDPRIGKYMHQVLTEEQWLEFTAPIGHSFGLPHTFSSSIQVNPYHQFCWGYTENYMDYESTENGKVGNPFHRGANSVFTFYKWQWDIMRNDKSLRKS